MPREIKVWKVDEPTRGMTICPRCEGWGGEDYTQCYGFGAKEDWHDCFTCGGCGQISEAYAERLKRYDAGE